MAGIFEAGKMVGLAKRWINAHGAMIDEAL